MNKPVNEVLKEIRSDSNKALRYRAAIRDLILLDKQVRSVTESFKENSKVIAEEFGFDTKDFNELLKSVIKQDWNEKLNKSEVIAELCEVANIP